MIEKIDQNLTNLSPSINQIKAQQLFDAHAKESGTIKRLTSTEASNYVIKKVQSAQRMYNTSFSQFRIAASAGPYYKKWLSAIVSGITESDCIVHEVMLSRERLDEIKGIYRECGLPLRGAYFGYELSNLSDIIKIIPFVEFIIFENSDGSSEVIFGWTTSPNDSLGNDCFYVTDKHVIDYFFKQFKRYENLTTASLLDK